MLANIYEYEDFKYCIDKKYKNLENDKNFADDVELMKVLYNKFKDGEIMDRLWDGGSDNDIFYEFKTLDGYYYADIVAFLEAISKSTGFEFTIAAIPTFAVDESTDWWEYDVEIFKGYVPEDKIDFSYALVDYDMMQLIENTLPDCNMDIFADLVLNMSDNGLEAPDPMKVTLEDLTDFMKNSVSGVSLKTVSGKTISRKEFLDEAEKYFQMENEVRADNAKEYYYIGNSGDLDKTTKIIAAAFREYYKNNGYYKTK